MPVYTLGYGNRPISDFIALLRHYAIDLLIDTRSVPYSRFRPAYRKQAFQEYLQAAGFEYRYLGDVLGGKHPDPSAVVDGQLDLARLYALPAFRAGLDEIEAAARSGRIPAIMCAELRPEACHRYWMLTPPLVERGLEVLHIDEHGGLKTMLF